jgi:phosphoinositide-3-kinase regulatory subunit 4
MGNQLSGVATSQTFGIESYLSDLPNEFELINRDANLGSTRFLKVAKVKHREGDVVVKLLVKPNPSLSLAHYQDELQVLKEAISSCTNLLPFQLFFETERAGFLIRQYGRFTLYDRMSTRPYLSVIEKKWIAFQLLVALEQCQSHEVCHGDIKSENVIVTGWSWALLTDFASFKPVLLPEDNPSDFDFFFDTSRRRSCYIAPERFYDPNTIAAEPFLTGGKQDAQTVVTKENESGIVEPVLRKATTLASLSPAMDIFSMGCVFFELFTDGRRLFDLSQLLAYRTGKYDIERELQYVEDQPTQKLIRDMVHVNPWERLTANEYLHNSKDILFPREMYSFLVKYCKLFANQPVLTSDEKIARLKRDFPNILQELSHPNPRDRSQPSDLPTYDCLVIIISLITSCLRSLQFSSSKLDALELLQQLADRASDECILDRLVPFMVRMVHDDYPCVKATALRVLTHTLACIHTLPRSETNIFPEYILPSIVGFSINVCIVCLLLSVSISEPLCGLS